MSQSQIHPAAAVIVIDLQTGMFDGIAEPPLHDADKLVDRARMVIGWARRSGRKVAFVRHDGPQGDSLAPGAAGWPVWPALGQVEDEPTFSKSVGDAFSNPGLVDWVAAGGGGEVVLLGAQTDACVAATVEGALARGLRVTVVEDAHSTWGAGGETAAEIISRCNEGFRQAGAKLVAAQALAGADGRETAGA